MPLATGGCFAVNPASGKTLDGARSIWADFDVKRAWLFGGRARGEADAGSDWDFLVEFASKPGFANFMGLKCALEDALGSKVDVLSRSAAKTSFLARIEKELVDVY
jgi:predicted nucleotidyltransferase